MDEIAKNSKESTVGLKLLQNEILKTSAVTTAANAKNGASYLNLSKAIDSANNSCNNMGVTVATIGTLMSNISATTAAVTNQTNLLTASVNLLNQSLMLGNINFTNLTSSIALNTLALSANLVQNAMSTMATDLFSISVGLNKSEIETLTQIINDNTMASILNSGEILLNSMATDLNSASKLLNSEILMLYNQMVDANSATVLSNTAAILANVLANDMNSIALALSSEKSQANSAAVEESINVSGKSSEAVDENSEKTDELAGAKKALSNIEAILAGITIFQTAVGVAKSVADGKALLTSKKVQQENKKETLSETTKGIAKLGNIIMTPAVGIFLGIAAVAALAGAAVILRNIVSAPAMATGGVVSSPTMALVGEGRYPEAVVPLGNSPQFASMKNDIAAAVLQGMNAFGANGKESCGKIELVVNLDGKELARKQIDHLENEYRRRGYAVR